MFWELCHVWYTELVTYPFHINSVSVDNQFQSSSRSFEYDHEEFGSISWFRIFRYPRDHPKPNDEWQGDNGDSIRDLWELSIQTFWHSSPAMMMLSQGFSTLHRIRPQRRVYPYKAKNRHHHSNVQYFQIFGKMRFFSSVFQFMNRDPLLTNGR